MKKMSAIVMASVLLQATSAHADTSCTTEAAYDPPTEYLSDPTAILPSTKALAVYNLFREYCPVALPELKVNPLAPADDDIEKLP